MEYLEHGDLLDYLYSRPPIPEDEARDIGNQILDALHMMHENGFAHRDLKPNNILIRSQPPDEWWIKLADFGISKRIGEGLLQSTTVKGTPRYFAPELWGFIRKGSIYASDIWALGAIIFEMLTKTSAFTTAALADYKNEQQFPSSVLTEAGVSQLGVDFVHSLMRPYPSDRSTSSAAQSSSWIKSAPANSLENLPVPHAISNSAVTEYQAAATMSTWNSASWTVAPRPESTTIDSLSQEMSRLNSPITDLTIGHIRTPDTSQGQTATSGSIVAEQSQTLTGPSRSEEAGPTPSELKYQAQAARILSRQGDVKEADVMFRKAIEGQERVMGPNHPDTLSSVQWLGISLDQQGFYREAEKMFTRAKKGREKELGQDHEDTLFSAQWLGISLNQQGKYRAARRIFRKTVAGQRNRLGNYHEHTLFSEYWLGVSLVHLQKFKEAEGMFLLSLQGREQVLGIDHEDTLSSAQWLGNCLNLQDKHKEAETMFGRAHQGRLNVLNPDHPHTLHSAQALGASLLKQHRFDDADELLRETLKKQETIIGQDHEDTVATKKLVDKLERKGRSRSRIWLSNTTTTAFSHVRRDDTIESSRDSRAA